MSLSLFPDADAVGATHADVDVVITRNKRHVPTYGRVADVGSGNVKIHGRPGILTACRKFPASRGTGHAVRLFPRRQFFLASSRLIVDVIPLLVVAAARDATRSSSNITLRLVTENLRYFCEGTKGK